MSYEERIQEALDAILELHKPARYFSIDQGCSVCRFYEAGVTVGLEPIPYPCPTVQVILGIERPDALGQEQG